MYIHYMCLNKYHNRYVGYIGWHLNTYMCKDIFKCELYSWVSSAATFYLLIETDLWYSNEDPVIRPHIGLTNSWHDIELVKTFLH